MKHKNADIVFFHLHYNFLFAHFKKAFKKYGNEGYQNAVTNIALEALESFLNTGKKLRFNSDYPWKHDEIITFFHALYELYAGDASAYSLFVEKEKQ